MTPDNVEKMLDKGEYTLEKLLEVAEALNDSQPMKDEGASVELEGWGEGDESELADQIMRAFERNVPENRENEVGEAVLEFYSEMVPQEEYVEEKQEDVKDEEEEKEEEKPDEPEEEKPAPKKKKKGKKVRKESVGVEKDEFGFRIGTKNSLFVKALREKPRTMKEIQELEWNKKKGTFYTIFKKLEKDEKAYKEGKVLYLK